MLVVIDPRASRNISRSLGAAYQDDPPDNGVFSLLQHERVPPCKLTVFLLMPSTTSAPESMLNVEVGLQNLSAAENVARDYRDWWDSSDRGTELDGDLPEEKREQRARLPNDWLRVVRVDDYAYHGDHVLVLMYLACHISSVVCHSPHMSSACVADGDDGDKQPRVPVERDRCHV